MNAAVAQRKSSRAEFVLYVGGGSAASLAAEATLRALVSHSPEWADAVSVTDVDEEPEAAWLNHVVATPSLVVRANGKTYRMIGDFSRGDQLQELLRLLAEVNR